MVRGCGSVSTSRTRLANSRRLMGCVPRGGGRGLGRGGVLTVNRQRDGILSKIVIHFRHNKDLCVTIFQSQ